MFEKCDSSNCNNESKFYSKIWVGFCLKNIIKPLKLFVEKWQFYTQNKQWINNIYVYH